MKRRERERKRERERVCVYVWGREGKRECVCVIEKGREEVWERERERQIERGERVGLRKSQCEKAKEMLIREKEVILNNEDKEMILGESLSFTQKIKVEIFWLPQPFWLIFLSLNRFSLYLIFLQLTKM